MEIKILKSWQNTTPECNGVGISVSQDGVPINLLNFTEFPYITIDRIATSLARIMRYGGNSRMRVAQHCVRGADAFLVMGDPKLAYIFLHHESMTECMGFSDIPGPVKGLLGENLKKLEEYMERTIAPYLEVEYPFPKEIKIVDRSLAQDEMMMMKHQEFDKHFDYWSEEKAKEQFVNMHYKLKMYIDVYSKKELV